MVKKSKSSRRRKSPKKSTRRKSPKKSRRRKSHTCSEGTRLLKRPVKEGGKIRYCTKLRKSTRRKSPKKSTRSKSPKKSTRRKSPKKSRRRKSHTCSEGTRLLKRPVKEGGKIRYCTKLRKSTRRKSPKKSRKRKSPKKSRRRRSCKYGELKNPVLSGGRKRYCKLAPKRRKSPKKSRKRKSPKKSTRRKSPKKSRRRKSHTCSEGTRLLKRPVKEGGKIRYCTKLRKSTRRKSPKKSRAPRRPPPPRPPPPRKRRKPAKRRKEKTQRNTYECSSIKNDRNEILGKACNYKASGEGEFKNEKECLDSNCETVYAQQDDQWPFGKDVTDSAEEKALCRETWCTGALKGKKWGTCYRKNALKLHPDKQANKSEYEKKKNKTRLEALIKCNSNSGSW